MALHPDFPGSPWAIASPETRWFPADESLRTTAYGNLLPPLVAKIREGVAAWRQDAYAGASLTSRALLEWWFGREHLIEQADGALSTFQYYFAQREAVETVIWLYEVKRARDKFDLMRFDSSGAIATGMFDEDWTRYVVKMATGSGKTKVLSLLMAWSYFHRLYEPGSDLSRNILLIAPNIIVLDRLRSDFDGLKIFFDDPVLPDNGHEGHNWRDDFQMTVHVQDEVRMLRPVGNLFLTNVHRVYATDVRSPSLEDDDLREYFLDPFGPKPVGKTTDSHLDVGDIVREIDELAVFNDEAHHVHDEKLAWFKSIRDIHNGLLQKDRRLAVQIDVTATPKHNNGAIFVQTVSDYPLVEAIHQNVVKHPVLPDAASVARLEEHKSPKFTERYDDYLRLGIEEWRSTDAEHRKLGKKAILFVMVDDTKNCDETGAYLEKMAPELEGKVLVIHTNKSGDLSKAKSGKAKDEVDRLRAEANCIDGWDSPYQAIVSVLMLKEGWNVRNVTTIVGLRAYSAKSNILPEQTLGRGLRRMYFGSPDPEYVSVIGTAAFMEFVESIQTEGVEFERRPMGASVDALKEQLVVEVDHDDQAKDLDVLDIAIPRLTRRYQREFRDLSALDITTFTNPRIPLKSFSPEETREIIFKTMLENKVHHTVTLDGVGRIDYRAVVGFFARQLLKELRLVGGYDLLYPCVRDFMRNRLFKHGPVDLTDPVVARNLAEPDVAKILTDTFTAAINALTIKDTGSSEIQAFIRLREMRPFRTGNRPHLVSGKTPFNRIVAEPNAGGLELDFARFLDAAPDVVSFAKNYLAVGFRIDYVRANGDLSNYVPDFIVKDAKGNVTIIETKGREELDLPQKMARLRQWCGDATSASEAQGGPAYGFIYVDEVSFRANLPKTLAGLRTAFTEYQT